jgi:hypothetical protein
MEVSMNKGSIFFLVGLFAYMAGIYLSTITVVAGAAVGVLGGLMMGASTYFYIAKR